ncbi:uncharacterized protein BP01DRAFT_366062 [Aspergillus saccharolyticus JOP 1030-1]|uniref:Uncharacterized protein n=1 Tax=Aspergillus saccharolyticus JOP 1030-1 TaxID=1450539 RepID=A0A318ZJV0_9EURO|nr:hypothetical protein BP01DRAFT_366062 [Aspergillus saccharolyticus JOP 1030-1]PYH44833.1 hypothetical protein BP01DRAFT_366062 [Aspergillus saccharolyticus JOP 1030-1]
MVVVIVIMKSTSITASTASPAAPPAIVVVVVVIIETTSATAAVIVIANKMIIVVVVIETSSYPIMIVEAASASSPTSTVPITSAVASVKHGRLRMASMEKSGGRGWPALQQVRAVVSGCCGMLRENDGLLAKLPPSSQRLKGGRITKETLRPILGAYASSYSRVSVSSPVLARALGP